MESSVRKPGDGAPSTDGWPGVVGLRWGVKASFLRYLSRTPDADVLVAAGAGLDDEGQAFTFPVRGVDRDGDDLTLGFGGEVCMTAHAGFLRVVIAAPAVEVAAGLARLTCAGSGGAGSGGAGDPTARRLLAHLAWPPVRSADSWTSRAHLAAEAVPVFDGVYRPGEELDPLHLDLAVGRPR